MKSFSRLMATIAICAILAPHASAQSIEQQTNVLNERVKTGDVRALTALGYLYSDGKNTRS